MNRRAFIRTVIAVPLAAAAAPLLPRASETIRIYPCWLTTMEMVILADEWRRRGADVGGCITVDEGGNRFLGFVQSVEDCENRRYVRVTAKGECRSVVGQRLVIRHV